MEWRLTMTQGCYLVFLFPWPPHAPAYDAGFYCNMPLARPQNPWVKQWSLMMMVIGAWWWSFFKGPTSTSAAKLYTGSSSIATLPKSLSLATLAGKGQPFAVKVPVLGTAQTNYRVYIKWPHHFVHKVVGDFKHLQQGYCSNEDVIWQIEGENNNYNSNDSNSSTSGTNNDNNMHNKDTGNSNNGGNNRGTSPFNKNISAFTKDILYPL